MHRSGTSAITRSLRVLGVELGDHLIPPMEGNNPTGFWEDADINRLNIEMLAFLQRDWYFLAPIQAREFEALRENGFFLRAAEILRRKTNGVRSFGLKDPRISILLPFWKEVFAACELQASYILSVRHPLSVCESLAKRDGFDFERGYLLWMKYMIASLVHVVGENCIVVDYDNLMRSPHIELDRMSRSLALEIDPQELATYTNEFLDRSLQHTVYRLSDLEVDTPPLAREIYAESFELANDRASLRDAALADKLTRWSGEFARLQALLKLADKLEMQILAGNQAMLEKDRALNSLYAQMHEKEQYIQGLLSQIEKWDAQAQVFVGQVQSLSAQLHEKEQSTRNLLSQIEKWDAQSQVFAGQVQSLSAQVDERNGQISNLQQAVIERDGQVSRLNQELAQSSQALSARLADREHALQDLSAQLTDKGQNIQSLSTQLLEKEQTVQSLAVQAAELEQKIQALSKQLENKKQAAQTLKAQLTAIQTSRTWRLALFVRKVRTSVAHPGQLLAPLLNSIRKSRSAQKQRNDALLVKNSGLFDPAWYLSQYPDIAQAGLDPLIHYLGAGGLEGRDPGPNFSSALYLQAYPDIQKAKKNPLVHYLNHGKREGRLAHPSLAAANPTAANPQPQNNEPNPRPLDPQTDKDRFDATWYLAFYPDIAAAGVDPYQHYLQHGKSEGRLGYQPDLVLQPGLAGFDPSKENVLVVSHDASRTGAPILSLNIVQNLQQQYNVVSLLLGEGSIAENFLAASAFMVDAGLARGSYLLAEVMIEQLTKTHDLKFAIVNSIESRAVIPALAKRHVPVVHLIHEFAAYTRPKDAFREALFWSHAAIFSASVTHKNAVSEYPELDSQPVHIIPQGLCVIPSAKNDAATETAEEARILGVLRPDGVPAGEIVVLGVGTVSLRKGVDLFIDCASRIVQSAAGRRFRFVWIGSGYDPIQDVGYSVYLYDQIQRAGLQEHLFFMKETSNIKAAYRAADILLVSSRLDPLPNVGIDAMMHELPLVCFQDTTGIADILVAHGLGEECVSPYLDTADMAAKVMAFANSPALRKQVGEQLHQAALQEFDMENYMSQVTQVAEAAIDQAAREQADMTQIASANVAQLEYFLPQHLSMTAEEAVGYYVRMWACGIDRRKLFPGFHPGIYAERHGLDDPQADPLADYLRAGQPSGPWRYDVIPSNAEVRALPPEFRAALHLHVFYADLLPDILERLNANQVRPDLFVSVPTEALRAEVQAELAQKYPGRVVDVKVVPNRGRDIGPFLTAFGQEFIAKYDVVGHIHTKKTADVQGERMARDWYRFLLENLLGGTVAMADIILGRLASDPSIGIIHPDDPYVVGWDKNKPYAIELGRRLGILELPEHFLFPVGTMFWARTEALLPLLELGLDWQDYPAEPLPYDGSMLHAIERLLPFVTTSRGYRSALTHVQGVTR
ncbi:MAG: rhamnan synthesis F family protein [Chloroflexota bacterium]